MAKYAVHNGQEVINIVVADSIEIAELVAGKNVMVIDELPIGVGWYLQNDKWFPPKTYESWIWNESSYNWEPPVEMPSDAKSIDNLDGKIYRWDESVVNWVEVQGE